MRNDRLERRQWMVGALGLASLAAFPLSLRAQLASAETATGFTLPGTRRLETRSRAGADYSIFITEPSGPVPPGGRPLLLFTDGNAYSGALADLVRLPNLPGTTDDAPVVVGVGYPGDATFNRERRTRDLVPEPGDTAIATLLGAPAGGSDAFLAFLLDELVPRLSNGIAIDRRRVSLAGHSLGGLFALHALATRPDAFHAVAAISPSIWVNAPRVWRGLQALQNVPDSRLPSSVLLGIARVELPSHPDRSETMLADAHRAQEQLQALEKHGTRVRLIELADENHMTSFVPCLPAIVRQAGAQRGKS